MASKPVSCVLGMLALLAVLPAGSAQAAPPPAHMKEYAIMIDATTLHPPTRWQVPGITPMIMTMDPDSTEAYSTTERRELKLKPGSYKFGTFTFDFPFQITLDGKLDFAQSLDQCVAGRGTQMLMVTCSRMYPYGGKREYDYK
ncbi:MAG: hypothetical protein AAB049_03100 [Nitrospirota bacterium]